MFRSIVIATLLAGALAGCSPATLVTTFNPSDAAFINEKGTATVKGQAFLRRNDGIVVYAAGSEVFLIPKTTYSDERMATIYGAGKMTTFLGSSFKNDDARFYEYVRKVVANGEGRFEFKDVAAGKYYVVTSVVWYVQVQQGGSLMERTTVADGQTVELIMTGL